MVAICAFSANFSILKDVDRELYSSVEKEIAKSDVNSSFRAIEVHPLGG
jgi:hypothetical protein